MQTRRVVTEGKGKVGTGNPQSPMVVLSVILHAQNGTCYTREHRDIRHTNTRMDGTDAGK